MHYWSNGYDNRLPICRYEFDSRIVLSVDSHIGDGTDPILSILYNASVR